MEDEAALRERERIANERFAELFGGVEFTAANATTKKPSPIDINADNEEEYGEEDGEREFEFRLFSSGDKSTAEDGKTTQKIILVDEEGEDLGEGAFIGKGRGEGYYFWDANSISGGKEGLQRVAISGEDILKLAASRNWGLEVPWRVTVLKSVGKNRKGKEVLLSKDEEKAGKKKPGKKRRIILRKRQRALEEVREKKRVEEERKEEGDKEKRTRRNREKKVKRRLKEKAEKAAKADAGETEVGQKDGEMNVSD